MPAIVGLLDRHLTIRTTHGALGDQAAADGIQVTVLQHTNDRDYAARALATYRRGGAEALHQREQDCAVVLFDATAQTFVLSRDVVGLHPLYYTESGGRFIFGSRIADLLREAGARARPDLSSFCALTVNGDAPAGGATYFEGVSSVPPGYTLILQNGRVRLLPAAALEGMGEAAEFAGRFLESVRRRESTSSATAVLVSGGLDSASIISCIEPARAFGITYGLQDGSAADESEYIDLLRATGRPIDRVDFYPTSDVPSIETNIRQTELPLVDDVSATLSRAALHARANEADVLLVGTWGDQVLSPFPPAHLRSIAPWRLLTLAGKARRFQRSMRDIDAPFILRALIRQSLREHVPELMLRARRRSRLRSSVFDLLLHHVPPKQSAPIHSYADAVRAGAFAPDQTQAIEAAIKWGWAHDLQVGLPFLDVQLLRLLINVSDTEAYLGDSLKPLLREAMRGRVPARLLERGDKGDYTAAIGRGRLPVAQIVTELNGLRRLISFGLMSEAAARKTLARLNDRREIAEADAALAGVLLGLDAWLRIFCEDANGKEG